MSPWRVAASAKATPTFAELDAFYGYNSTLPNDSTPRLLAGMILAALLSSVAFARLHGRHARGEKRAHADDHRVMREE